MIDYFINDEKLKLSSATIDTAYQGVTLTRTMGLLEIDKSLPSIVVDIFDVSSDSPHQYDLPVQYSGQFIQSNFDIENNTTLRKPLGTKAGYEHLWLTASAKPETDLAKVTWLNDNNHFYTQTSLLNQPTSFLFTQTGANDPDFNLRQQSAFIQRVDSAKNHQFINVIEPHGEYNPSREYTLQATSRVKGLSSEKIGDIQVLEITLIDDQKILLAINQGKLEKAEKSFQYKDKTYSLTGRYMLISPANKVK